MRVACVRVRDAVAALVLAPRPGFFIDHDLAGDEVPVDADAAGGSWTQEQWRMERAIRIG